MPDYIYTDLEWKESDDGWQRAFLSLDEGDTAWQPGSTKRVIYGPANVEYLQAPDGGVSAYVTKQTGG